MKTNDPTVKTQEKYRKILGIALEVFAKEGFRNTDVQVIADLANVGKGTIYRYFGNKEQLFLATARHSLQQAGEYMKKEVVGSEDPLVLPKKIGTLAVLRRIAIAYAKFYQNQPAAVEIMIQERSEFRESVYPSHLMHRAETREGLDQLLEVAVERGEIHKVEPKQVTNAFADLLYGSVVNGCLEGTKTKLVPRVEAAVDLFLYGLEARTK